MSLQKAEGSLLSVFLAESGASAAFSLSMSMQLNGGCNPMNLYTAIVSKLVIDKNGGLVRSQ